MRWAVVTGSEGGIGGALVSGFSRAGFRVIGIDMAPRSSFPDVHYICANLKDICHDKVYRRSLIYEIETVIGKDRLAVLINNAASQIVKATPALSDEDWFDTMHVNLNAPFILTRELLSMLGASKGSVINISSIHASLTKSGFAAYATSKAALNGLTRALAVDVGDRVRVNAICPAAIDTPMLVDGFKNDFLALSELKNFHPVRAIGLPNEIVQVALLMASDEVPFLNGAIFGLDGGIGARLHDPS